MQREREGERLEKISGKWLKHAILEDKITSNTSHISTVHLNVQNLDGLVINFTVAHRNGKICVFILWKFAIQFPSLCHQQWGDLNASGWNSQDSWRSLWPLQWIYVPSVRELPETLTVLCFQATERIERNPSHTESGSHKVAANHGFYSGPVMVTLMI